MDLSTGAWTVLAIAAVFVGLGKTALPGVVSVAVAMFAAVLPAKESTALLLILLLVGDIIAVWVYFKTCDWRTLFRLIPSVVIGVACGAAFLYFASDGVVRRSIGIIVLTLTFLTLAFMHACGEKMKKAVARSGVRGIYGALGGFTTMSANSGGPVMSMYFLASGFDVRRFLGTQAWFFFLINLVKLPFSAGIGLVTREVMTVALILAPVVIISCAVGKLVAYRINQNLFNAIVIVLTIVSAAYLLA